ncbi:hypothetical protein NL676_015156 [Syzygium grande]|nr:hypothetical protein NL676_015156 [Syzygium grande]
MESPGRRDHARTPPPPGSALCCGPPYTRRRGRVGDGLAMRGSLRDADADADGRLLTAQTKRHVGWASWVKKEQIIYHMLIVIINES